MPRGKCWIYLSDSTAWSSILYASTCVKLPNITVCIITKYRYCDWTLSLFTQKYYKLKLSSDFKSMWTGNPLMCTQACTVPAMHLIPKVNCCVLSGQWMDFPCMFSIYSYEPGSWFSNALHKRHSHTVAKQKHQHEGQSLQQTIIIKQRNKEERRKVGWRRMD